MFAKDPFTGIQNKKKFKDGVSNTLSAFHCNANLVKIWQQVQEIISHTRICHTLAGDNVAVYYYVWFDSFCPSQQLWSCLDGQFT